MYSYHFQTLLTGLLIILAIVGIAFAVVTDSDNETDAYPVDYITNFVYLLTYLW